MRVAIDALFLQPRMGGIEMLVRRLVPELAKHVDVMVIVNPAGAAHLRAVEEWPDEAAPLVEHPLLGLRGTRAVAELGAAGVIADRRGCDVVHGIAQLGPLWSRARRVTHIHDLTFLLAPDRRMPTTYLWRAVVPLAARRAHRVMTGSRASADRIVERLGVPAHRVDVVHNGHSGVPDVAPAEVRKRFGLGDGPLVLSVSQKRPHKNLGRLIEAVARLDGATLVLPGNPTQHEQELKAHAAELQARVAFLPYVADDELEGLYREATCAVVPSVDEGFGLPVLDAMARGVPVACADAAALPEVAGDAALLFDPYDVSAIADALARLLDDGDLRRRLSDAGRERQRAFTWSRAAEQIVEVYARAQAEPAA